MKCIIVFLSIVFCSCSTANRISSTGTYIVNTATEQRKGYQVITFVNFAGQYRILADTLAAGDTIKLNVIKFNPR